MCTCLFDLQQPKRRATLLQRAAPKPALHLWLAEDAGKRWTEVFFLAYSPFWMLWALCILVPFRLYDVSGCFFHHIGYMSVGA